MESCEVRLEKALAEVERLRTSEGEARATVKRLTNANLSIADKRDAHAKLLPRIQAERDRYRLALERIADSSCEAFEHQRIAREALSPGGKK